ncbi:hypothetical protein JCGZ_12701 [Jatropha curcas]|uniref:Glycine-rich protein n=2 Tax=Jatropha curcas TaxID=180498 RepID=A0A067KQ40_JATCU|nr:hypothetical protein JCGZ_12701 [Jatropha curcas]
MGFKKFKFSLFATMVIFLQLHLLLPPLHALPLLNTSTATDFHQEQKAINEKIGEDKGMTGELTVSIGIKRVVSVDRKGGGGGHGGGGHSTGSGAHGGEASGNGNVGNDHGATVVPLYAAGAMGHRQNNHHHHGANEATPTSVGPSYLVLAVLVVSFIQHFAQL